jgi:hypothetical protein
MCWLDSANQALIELRSQLQAGQPRSEIGQTIKKIEVLLSPGTASLVYAGTIRMRSSSAQIRPPAG